MIRLLLTSGRGPAECRIALVKALDAMRAEASGLCIDLDVAPGPDPDGYGPGSCIVVADGEAADTFAARWLGSIQWVAKSPVRPHHKRKNWFISCAKLDAGPVRPAALAEADVRFTAFRAGGPGGQHQNKTDSAVRAVHAPSGLTVVVRDGRSQHRNKAVALARLAELMRLAETLDAARDRAAVQAGHDRLERGQAVRTFRGEEFRE